MTQTLPSRRWPVFGRGLAILLAWHVVVAGIAAASFWPGPELHVWLAATITVLATVLSLVVAVPALAVLVWRAGCPAPAAAGVGALAGLVVAGVAGLVLLGSP
ncbi:hypothetical protein [Actinoplanes sp. L3-i22]|uniref:hypothetical protein n=1 Tax=Actinoplanes sp. L3-i22 TaxID=2836373 RepID=UPI001C76EDFF|nr:hypothetical protein [Actinoplanes sp. L3-i22]BCY11679.1 hypothetical protein L3i22_067670 [Actinoplanes sp. L3-i22]